MPTKTVVRRLLRAVPAAIVLAASPARAADATELEEIIVSAQLRERPVMAMPASVSVVSAQQIAAREARHVEQMLNVAPNINYTAGASRGRFVQVRGIGERSQFVDPLDPSVGLYIDGIDVSGLGNAGTLFDVEQVEILRGPQGTAYGASAIAGLVNIRSRAPTDTRQASLHGGLAGYGGTELGAVLSGPLATAVSGRLAVLRHRSDGYVTNDFLGRDDTNAIDETTLRARLDWQPVPDLGLELTALRVDADNGYDAFSLDDNRHTLSDQPGRDHQLTQALALHGRWDGWESVVLDVTATVNDTAADYGYDEDWSYPGLCAGTACEGWEYASTDRYLRDTDAQSLDLRLASATAAGAGVEWVAGAYAYQRDTALERHFIDFSSADWPPPAARFDSDYESTHLALYGELTLHPAPRLDLVAGLRAVRWEADYADSLQVDASPRENLWGGQLSAQYELGDAAMVYLLGARGFKAGGVNGEAIGKARSAGFSQTIRDYLDSQREFDTETLYNVELGYKGLLMDGALATRLALFWMRREDMQLKSWYNEGPLFVGYTDNGARGENYGLELELDWRASEHLRLDFALGLLGTETENFYILDADHLPRPRLVERSRKAQAQSPRWQFHAGAEYTFARGFFTGVQWEGKDSYYYSDSDDQHGAAYTLLHLNAGYRGERVEVSAWVRNALDEDYAVHAFWFGNDPRKFYANEAYHQYGEPRVAGVAITFNL